MVTGLEVAGIILATFPLIISGLDAYEYGFQTMKEWSHFRKEYLVFMTALGKQKLFFRQNITTLLDPIVKSEDHMLQLLEDPGGKDWKDPELNDMLRRRLEGLEETYECYMETVGSILALLEKLKGKLRLGEGEVCIKNPPIDISRNQKFADMKLIYIYPASLDYKSNCQWNGTLRI